MKSVLMFCESYDEIKSCLHFCKHHIKQNHIITVVVFGNYDLSKFLDEINDRVFYHRINVLYLELFKGKASEGIGINRVFDHITNIIKARKYYQELYVNHFATFKGADVYFFTRYYTPYNFYLLKKLVKNNKLIFMCVLDWEDRIRKHILRSIYELMSLTKLKLIYGFGMTIAKLPHANFPYMPDNFISKEVDRVISLEETEELLADFDFNEFNIFDSGHYSIIFFEQPLVDADRVQDAGVFKRELDEIFSVLTRYFPEKEIAIKYHPTGHSDKNTIKTGVVLEDFIPAELLYNDNVKMYLSFSSGSLANVEKGLAVSLIDLISFKDKDAKKFIKENLVKRSRSEILFPQSLDEFEDILINTTRNL